MGMKHIVAAVLTALLCLSVAAQSMRTVTGSVVDSDGNPIVGAVISEKGGGELCRTGEDGKFSVSVASSVRYLTASAEMYVSTDAEVDGSFLVFRLKADQAGLEAEREAKAAETKKAKAAAAIEGKYLDDEYGKKFRNKGIVNTLELSYGYQLSSGEVICTNYGYQNYGNLNPVSAEYMLGYRFSRLLTVSAGAGFSYSISDPITNGDSPDEATYGQPEFRKYDVPVFLNVSAYFGRGKVQPMVSASGGWYLMSNTLMADAGVGCAFRFGRIFNMYVLASVRTTPWPSFQGPSWEGYKPAVTPGLKIGFML